MLFGRRVRFAVFVLASQLLLIGLAVVMFIQLMLIASHGEVQFIERSPTVLTTEIFLTLVVGSFGILVFVIQLRRLREKRSADLWMATSQSVHLEGARGGKSRFDPY